METNINVNQTRHYPLLPLRNAVIFPRATMPIVVGRQRSVSAVRKAQATDNLIVLATQVSGHVDEPNQQEIYRLGTLCRVESLQGSAEAGYQAVITGLHRYQITDFRSEGNHFEVNGHSLDDILVSDPIRNQALFNSLKDLSKDLLDLLPGVGESAARILEKIQDPATLSDLVATYLNLSIEKKQNLLETLDVQLRLDKLIELVSKEKEVLRVQKDIKERMSDRLNKAQRQALLREQMRAIKEELGEIEDSSKQNFRKRIDDAQMPDDVKKVADDELTRLETMPNASAEYHVIANYLDWLCSMPWKKQTEDVINLEEAQKILDTDHFDLVKVKKRIIQHLSVMKLRKDVAGSILCLVGPPGVGKTSLGQSIARSLGREFVRVSLGGVRDDSEVRGHRRTYIGSMPGRIVQGIKRTGVNNPVMMLDEIDKLGMSMQGDPGSALLEVLDPEQNNKFVDHYLDVPFDLSKVFFICTANMTDTIPAPLRDRMEIISLSGYTVAEKVEIAKRYIFPKQTKENGLTPEQVNLDDSVFEKIALNYTRESGVRNLERKLAELLRHCAEEVVRGKPTPIHVDVSKAVEILGPETFLMEVLERKVKPGVVTGLAWTPMGGDILFIEATQMPGSGKLNLTGQLGDVMKESAQIALSLFRSTVAHAQNPQTQFSFDKLDFHLHVPAGAIPKDGPSAGITMLTALVSLVSGKVVDPKLAMTGEVTLRGTVLPIGGVKEKLIAAHRAGVERIILPSANKKDLVDVPDEVKKTLKIHFVETIDDVVSIALGIQTTNWAQLINFETTKTVGIGIS